MLKALIGVHVGYVGIVVIAGALAAINPALPIAAAVGYKLLKD